MSTNEADGNSSGSGNASSQPDPITNLKSEMSRKTEKLAQENARLAQQLDAVLGKLNNLSAPAASGNLDEDAALEELAFKDPKEYARRVREQATRQATQMVDQRIQQQNNQQATLSALVNDYPELQDAGSDLTKRAVEIFKGLSQSEQSSPLAYKAAVREAAAELGVLPKTKRKTSSSDDFSFSGSNSGSGSQSSRGSGSNDKLDERTVAFAKLIGLKTDDPKVVERIKQRSKRKSWSRYE